MITPQDVAARLTSYLRGNCAVEELVDWAERVLIEEDFADRETRDATARLGLADTRAFGLTWDDARGLLETLGYTARVEVAATSSKS